ncbi:single-stranded DNA-binding protein [candidate division KSB1 bacterium]|nr:single-stranded DNA-binding protein [candidate division KSB1 bacterium]
MQDLKMPDINNVIIAGNLTCDPSFRKTTNGTPVANFFIASNRKFKDNSGQWRENVCYVGIVAWYKLAESCYENLKRGSAIIVDGELQSRNWRNNDGTSHNVVEIKARRIQFLNRKFSGSEADGDDVDSEIIEDDEYQNASSDMDEDGDTGSSSKPSDDTSDYDFGYQNLNI